MFRPRRNLIAQAKKPVLAASVIFIVALTFSLGLAEIGLARPSSQRPFEAQFSDAKIFSDAIAHARGKAIESHTVSGLTIPHHLLAADLIAQSFAVIDTRQIDKVIVLLPDHFMRSHRAFATTVRSFNTVFGQVQVSKQDVQFLLKANENLEASDLFADEHGIGTILPFIRYYLPTATVIPIAVSVRSSQADCDTLVTALKRILNSRTLVIQSTDFSHYLPAHEATQNDQQLLNILAAGKTTEIKQLRQRQHLDSRSAQYIQLRLQQEFFHAQPTVIFNANSVAYSLKTSLSTTSYIVQLYEAGPPRKVGKDMPGSKVYCFAGDTFFGREMLPILIADEETHSVLHDIQAVLDGCRLVANLTGVVMPELPVKLENLILAMPSDVTLRWLRALNVVAVNLANNHTMDLGSDRFHAMVDLLTRAGVVALEPGVIADLGAFRLVALTDVDNRSKRSIGVIQNSDIAKIAHASAAPPLFAMINWGPDLGTRPADRQSKLMEALHEAAVSLIVGVHPHQAAANLDILGDAQGLSIYSLGNFLFDEDSRVASGTLLEVRVFDQGTFFARLIPHPNFYEQALKRSRPN
jgi:AmmeMemoRadiSam system protein B